MCHSTLSTKGVSYTIFIYTYIYTHIYLKTNIYIYMIYIHIYIEYLLFKCSDSIDAIGFP